MNLADILRPTTVESFLGEYWEKKPLLIPPEPGRFTELFQSKDIGRLLSYGRPRLIDGLMLVKDSRHHDENWISPDGAVRLDKVRSAYQEGFTLVVNQLSQIWEPAAVFAAELQQAIHHPVGLNLYVTPANSRGFHAHFDVMDTLLLQLEGAKRWRVHGPQVQLPLPDEHTATPEGRVPPLLLEHTLEAGGALYIPRGFVHEALTTTTASVHITVGVHVVTWIDLISAAVLAARSDPRMRRALSPGFLTGAEAMAGIFDDLVATLPQKLNLELALAQLAERLIVQKRPTPSEALLTGEPELSVASALVRRAGVVCRLLETEHGVALQYTGGKLAGPAKIGPALRFVAESQAVLVRQLPGLSDHERLVLARRLIREGVLTLSEAS